MTDDLNRLRAVTLTDDEYKTLAAASSGYSPRKKPGDWEYSFPHDALVSAVESIVAARTAALLDRAERAERERDQWKDRLWVSVRERAVWSHEAGQHTGDVPFHYCPICEATFHRKQLAALRAAVTNLADEWGPQSDDGPVRVVIDCANAADALRSLLAAAPTETEETPDE